MCCLTLESPSHIPSIPNSLGYYRARVWVPWVLTANSHWLSIYKCWCTCIHAALSIHVTLSLLFPTLVRESVLYVCISSAAMWTDSSDPSFSILCFSFSDWLACLICSRFIPFFRTDSNVFLFMAAFHPGSDCSLAMFWGGSWSHCAPFQFGLPVWVLTAELLLGEPSEVCEHGAAHSSLAGALSPQGPQGSGSGVTGLRPGWEEQGCLCARQQGGAATGENEDEVDVSCVQLSADRRSISEHSEVRGGGRGENSMCKWRVFSLISVWWPRGWPSWMFFRVGGQFSCPCFFRRLSFPLGSFLVWFSWTDHVHMGSFLASLFFPGVHVSVFLPVPHCGGYYRSVM